MRFFTDNSGNFNWAAIGGLCAVVGSIIAVATFFSPLGSQDASTQNINTVLGDYVTGNKIEGITLDQYEAGLLRREREVIDRLQDKGISSNDAKVLQATLKRIDARQADLQASYGEVKKITAEIRAFQNSVNDPDLLEKAVLEIFDGDTFQAADKALSAGVPLTGVGTIENTSTVFQDVRTETDFLRFVAEKDLVFSDNTNYVRRYGRNGSINGYSFGFRNGTGSWAFVDGKYCEEFKHKDTFYPQYCPRLSVTRSAVKFVYSDSNTAIYSIQ